MYFDKSYELLEPELKHLNEKADRYVCAVMDKMVDYDKADRGALSPNEALIVVDICAKLAHIMEIRGQLERAKTTRLIAERFLLRYFSSPPTGAKLRTLYDAVKAELSSTEERRVKLVGDHSVVQDLLKVGDSP